VATMKQEAEWRAEFEKLGDLLVCDNAKQGAVYNDDEKRQAAFRWLSERAGSRREMRTLQILIGLFLPAIAAMLIGVMSFLMAIRH
jgi:hypothetical protein